MSYLVDTNVLSERLKKSPSAAVSEWLRQNETSIYVSTITIAEIRRGIEKLPESDRKLMLHSWLQRINFQMKGSILSFNRSVAHTWGQMQGALDKKGKRLSYFDSLLAATAVRYSLTIVTRNVRDFEAAPVRILNPFES